MSRACAVCGGRDGTTLFERPPDHDPAGPPFRVVRCDRCGTEALDPLPTEEQLAAAYGAGYYEERGPKGGTATTLQRLAHRAELSPLRRVLRPGARVLEVGCGTGELLAAIRDRYGAEVSGIDRTPQAIEAVRAKGIAGTLGSIEDHVLPESSVDVMIMRHVLEHVPAPRDLLVAARKTLAPGGTLFVTVPVTGGWDHRAFGARWEGYEIPQHLHLFPPRVITRLFDEAGLRVTARRFSVVPNPWVKGARALLCARGRARLSETVTIRNPAALLLAAPVGIAAGLAGRSGRLTVLATQSA